MKTRMGRFFPTPLGALNTKSVCECEIGDGTVGSESDAIFIHTPCTFISTSASPIPKENPLIVNAFPV